MVKCQHKRGGQSSVTDDTFAWHMEHTKLYLEQNLGPSSPSTPVDGFAIKMRRLNHLWDGHAPSPAFSVHGAYSTTNYDNVVPFPAPSIVETDVVDLLDELTVDCGATLPAKDSTWVRIMNTVINDTGGNENDYDLVEGYPTLAAGTYPTHSQSDGIPDSWKTTNGLSTAINYTGVSAPSGYDWVEEYINQAAGDPAGAATVLSPSLAENITTTDTATMAIDAPINIVPGAQTITTNVQTAIPDLEVVCATGNLSTVRLTVQKGTLFATAQGGATIT
jgi:hypothetical protein